MHWYVACLLHLRLDTSRANYCLKQGVMLVFACRPIERFRQPSPLAVIKGLGSNSSGKCEASVGIASKACTSLIPTTRHIVALQRHSYGPIRHQFNSLDSCIPSTTSSAHAWSWVVLSYLWTFIGKCMAGGYQTRNCLPCSDAKLMLNALHSEGVSVGTRSPQKDAGVIGTTEN